MSFLDFQGGEQECERHLVAVVGGPGPAHGPAVPGSWEVRDSCQLWKTVAERGQVWGEVWVSSQAGHHPDTLPLQSKLELLNYLATSTFLVVWINVQKMFHYHRFIYVWCEFNRKPFIQRPRQHKHFSNATINKSRWNRFKIDAAVICIISSGRGQHFCVVANNDNSWETDSALWLVKMAEHRPLIGCFWPWLLYCQMSSSHYSRQS